MTTNVELPSDGLIKITKVDEDEVRDGGHCLQVDFAQLEYELYKMGEITEGQKVVQYNIDTVNKALHIVVENY